MGRVLRSTVAVWLVAAACGGSARSPSVDRAETAPSPTSGAAVTTTPEAPIAEPVAEPGSATAVPAVAGPAGPQPSFNESAGCGSLQGYRGPMVAEPGYQADDVMIAGPWGDYFGRTIGEIRGHLTLMTLPTVGDDTDNKVWVHERVAPALQRVIDALLEHQVMGLTYRIEVTSSFRPETVPPHRYLSFHAVGAAIDINPASNPYRSDAALVTDLPDWFVEIWRDAGWCWGGDWQDIKDPMHFSWRGPLHSAGYSAWPPFPPSTEAASYRTAVTVSTYLGPAPAGSAQLVADVDRDGAPDAVRVSPWTGTGRLGVEAARARHGYATCWATGVTARPAVPGAAVLLADRTGDGRPDLWEIGGDGAGPTVVVHAFASGFRAALPPVNVPTAVTPDDVYLVGDHDLDGASDLYVLRPGDPSRLDVYAGPDFDPLTSVTLPVVVNPEWRFTLGDHDGDAVPDLYALAPGSDPDLVIVAGGGGFTTAISIATGITGHTGSMSAADFDGDGREDLMFFDLDGTLTVYFGGDTAGATAADLGAWFTTGTSEPWGDGRPWAPGNGCRQGVGASQRR